MSLGICLIRRIETRSHRLASTPRELDIRRCHPTLRPRVPIAQQSTLQPSRADVPIDKWTRGLDAWGENDWRTSDRPYTPDRKSAQSGKKIKAYEDLKQQLAQDALNRSALLRPAHTYSSRRESELDQRKQDDSAKQQAMLEKLRQTHGWPKVDWRHILLEMTKRTPELRGKWYKDGLRVVIPRRAANKIRQGVDESLDALERATGAKIGPFLPDGSEGSSELLLSGTAMALHEAVAALHGLASRVSGNTPIEVIKNDPTLPFVDSDRLSDTSSTAPKSVQKSYWTLNKDIRDVEEPSAWTEKSFRDHIQRLVTASVPKRLLFVIYGPNPNHVRVTADLLVSLFQRESTQAAISSVALNTAVEYLAPHGHSLRDASVSLLKAGLSALPRIEPATFNLLLRGAVKAHDVDFFHHILRMSSSSSSEMVGLKTWTLFLRMMESEAVKRQILLSMHHKNLLALPNAIRMVAEEMAEFDAQRAAAAKKDASSTSRAQQPQTKVDQMAIANEALDVFFEEQVVKYGADWLTLRTGNKIIDVFGKYGEFEMCLGMLDRMTKAAETQLAAPIMARAVPIRPNAESYHRVFDHLRIRKIPHLALDLLERMSSDKAKIKPDATIYHYLFQLAWNARLPTALKVIWHYASIDQKTTAPMRLRVSKWLSGRLTKAERRKFGVLESENVLQLLASWGIEEQDVQRQSKQIAHDGSALLSPDGLVDENADGTLSLPRLADMQARKGHGAFVANDAEPDLASSITRPLVSGDAAEFPAEMSLNDSIKNHPQLSSYMPASVQSSQDEPPNQTIANPARPPLQKQLPRNPYKLGTYATHAYHDKHQQQQQQRQNERIGNTGGAHPLLAAYTAALQHDLAAHKATAAVRRAARKAAIPAPADTTKVMPGAKRRRQGTKLPESS